MALQILTRPLSITVVLDKQSFRETEGFSPTRDSRGGRHTIDYICNAGGATGEVVVDGVGSTWSSDEEL
jgi:hypothetical protein